MLFHTNLTVNWNGPEQEPLGDSGMDLTRPRSWGRVLQKMIWGSSFLSLPDLSLFPQTRHSRHARADSTGGNYFQASTMFGDKHNKSSLGRSYFLPSNVAADAAADSRYWSDTKNGGIFFILHFCAACLRKERYKQSLTCIQKLLCLCFTCQLMAEVFYTQSHTCKHTPGQSVGYRSENKGHIWLYRHVPPPL